MFVSTARANVQKGGLALGQQAVKLPGMVVRVLSTQGDSKLGSTARSVMSRTRPNPLKRSNLGSVASKRELVLRPNPLQVPTLVSSVSTKVATLRGNIPRRGKPVRSTTVKKQGTSKSRHCRVPSKAKNRRTSHSEMGPSQRLISNMAGKSGISFKFDFSKWGSFIAASTSSSVPGLSLGLQGMEGRVQKPMVQEGTRRRVKKKKKKAPSLHSRQVGLSKDGKSTDKITGIALPSLSGIFNFFGNGAYVLIDRVCMFFYNAIAGLLSKIWQAIRIYVCIGLGAACGVSLAFVFLHTGFTGLAITVGGAAAGLMYA